MTSVKLDLNSSIFWRDSLRKLFQNSCSCSNQNSMSSIQWYAQISYKPKYDFQIFSSAIYRSKTLSLSYQKSEDTVRQSSSSCAWIINRTVGTCLWTNPARNYSNLDPKVQQENINISVFWNDGLIYGKSDCTIRQSSSSSTWNKNMSFGTVS